MRGDDGGVGVAGFGGGEELQVWEEIILFSQLIREFVRELIGTRWGGDGDAIASLIGMKRKGPLSLIRDKCDFRCSAWKMGSGD